MYSPTVYLSYHSLIPCGRNLWPLAMLLVWKWYFMPAQCSIKYEDFVAIRSSSAVHLVLEGQLGARVSEIALLYVTVNIRERVQSVNFNFLVSSANFSGRSKAEWTAVGRTNGERRVGLISFQNRRLRNSFHGNSTLTSSTVLRNYYCSCDLLVLNMGNDYSANAGLLYTKCCHDR